MRSRICALALLIFTGCGPKASKPEVVTDKPIEVTNSWEEIEGYLYALPATQRTILGEDFYAQLKELKENSLFRVARPKGDSTFPLFPGYPITLHTKSKYDGTPLTFTVRAPLTNSAPRLTLLLGAKEDFTETLLDRSLSTWVVHIPSRDRLNYQLTAEGDLWELVKTIYSLYPQLRNAPLYLVGSGYATDAAILLAERERHRLNGLAFSGGSIGHGKKNLDSLPIASYGEEPASSPWGGHTFVETLQTRGNYQTLPYASSLAGALDFLFSQKKEDFSPYTFEDNSFNQPWSGIKVLARRTEKEPVHLNANHRGDTLEINAPNVLAIEIDRSKLPSSIRHIRLNESLYLLPLSEEVVKLGDEGVPNNWRKKGELPNSRLAFFKSEPLYVVWDDKTEENLSGVAENLAEQIAHLRFRGLPLNSKVRYPTLPLSQYDASSLPKHRVILVASTAQAELFLQESEGYLPFDVRGATYSLVYPKEKHDSCQLVWTIAAPTTEAMQSLSRELLTLPHLFSKDDLHYYPKQGNSFVRTFDSYWGSANSSSAALSIPPQPTKAWEVLLEELIVSETASSALLLSPLTRRHATPPSSLGYQDLRRFIPERNFAKITLRASVSAEVGNALLEVISQPITTGLDAYLTDGRFDPVKLRKQKKTLLVETEALAQLSSEQLASLQVEIYPYSLHELIDGRIQADAHGFGRELIRMGQTQGGETR